MANARSTVRTALALAVVLTAFPTRADDALFPFVLSYDAPASVANVADWLERPAGKHGPVRVENARMATDAGPIRFWGTNLCFEACFPEHGQAERMARRLASLGINCVRMHHMDSRSIWGNSGNHTRIDPDRLDRLDYLVYQLKLNGIYTNLNLHVSRWLDESDGFTARDSRPKYDKGLGSFEPRMIELQKKYARDLLAHVNPYTKMPYTRDPAIAMVEISNEDALYAVWGWGQLDGLADPYATTFRRLWNDWLRRKYGATDPLRKAWNATRVPLGDEMLAGGNFDRAFSDDWHMETDAETRAQWSVEKDGPDGSPFLRVTVERNGTESWRPQFTQSGLAVKRGHPYTLTCLVRADRERIIGVNCMMAHDPWQRLGLSATVKATDQWREHRFTFVASHDDENSRVTFTDLAPGTYEFARLSLRGGGIVGIEENQRLEDHTVPVVTKGRVNLTRPALADFADFLWETERDYWLGMYRYLKDDLGVVALVCGTQLSYGPAHIQASLDYIDAHAYWQHPTFPGRPWDRNDWFVRNVALVNRPGGTLASLANRRVLGKPFTVSEYNHPAPNAYAAEGFPMIAAIGGLQGWDGIFHFAYAHNTNLETDKIDSYFDIKANTTRLVHMPACAALFLRGDVAQGREQRAAPLSAEAERRSLRRSLSAWELTADNFGLPAETALVHRVGMDLSAVGVGPGPQTAAATDDGLGRTFTSDTDQITWNASRDRASYFTVDTPRSKLFTGFVDGRRFDLGRVSLAIDRAQLGWATVSMVAIDAESIGRPGRVLIAATGHSQNRGAELRQLGGDRITLGARWGDAPVLCEGIDATIRVPTTGDRAALFALDQRGARREQVPIQRTEGSVSLHLNPRFKTVWYELEIR